MTPLPVLTPAGIEPAFDLAAYYPLLIFFAAVVALAAGMLGSTHLGYVFKFIKPQKPTPVKQMAYESGMDTIGSARMQFDMKFYLIAILFLVFDVELLFLYPWAVIYRSAARGPSGMFLFGEMLVFIVLLAVGYIYVWKKKTFDW